MWRSRWNTVLTFFTCVTPSLDAVVVLIREVNRRRRVLLYARRIDGLVTLSSLDYSPGLRSIQTHLCVNSQPSLANLMAHPYVGYLQLEVL